MPRRKAPSARQGRGTPDLAPAPQSSPALPGRADWLDSTQARWVGLWSTELATYWVASDSHALYRLFDLLDEEARLAVIARERPFTEGSQGQLVPHPAVKRLAECRKQLLELEDRFGLSPKARLLLGAELGKAAAGLDAVNRLYAAADSALSMDDPRLADGDG